MDRGKCQATVRGVAENWTQLSMRVLHVRTHTHTHKISVYYDTFPRMEVKHLKKGVCFLICSQVSTDHWLTLPSSTASVTFPGPTPHPLMVGFWHLSSVPALAWRDQPGLALLASSQADS